MTDSLEIPEEAMYSNCRRILSAVGSVLLLTTLIAHTHASDDAAARIEFIFGTATIVSASGAKRPAEKGSPVFVGDTVVTEDARAQLRFTDGGFVGLLPRSEFKVNAYVYNGKPGGDEQISMSLLKGGLRTISGLIGKARESAYEMVTLVATIGIRGTEYTVLYGKGITGSVGHGRIAVCNAAGCIDVNEGQSYYVKDQNTKPAFTNKAASLPPPQPTTARLDESDAFGPADSMPPDMFRAGFSETSRDALSAPGSGAGDNGSVGGGIGDGPGGGNGGIATGGGGATQGIGFELIGSTAPNVENSAQRVSDFLHSNTLPGPVNGQGYGAGGKPK